jgi:antitoxin component of MazEF toxin-antitoxin module
MTVHKKLLKAEGCSLAVVIPKIWLVEQGNPTEVEMQLGESLLVVIPVTKAGRKVELINAEREKTEIK